MIQPGMKCKVRQSTPIVSAGTPVVVDKDTSTNEVIIGKTGMIFCRMPQGGSLFFEESNLEPMEIG
jgi:hypothetical protein